MKSEIDKLYAMIEDLEVAMMTTRRPDGQLVSRAMANQKRAAGADLWFVTSEETHKIEELEEEPHVNLAYYKDRTREWVSVSGRAILSRDRDLIDSLYQADWKAWLGDEGDGVRDGGPHDPRIGLILVEAESVVYSKSDRPMPLVLFQVVKSMITGEPPKVADLRELDREDLTAPHHRADLR